MKGRAKHDNLVVHNSDDDFAKLLFSNVVKFSSPRNKNRTMGDLRTTRGSTVLKVQITSF